MERIDEGMLPCFGHVERMERDKIAKRVYVGECSGSRSVWPGKRWIDTMKECLKKRGLDVWSLILTLYKMPQLWVATAI